MLGGGPGGGGGGTPCGGGGGGGGAPFWGPFSPCFGMGGNIIDCNVALVTGNAGPFT